MGKMYTLDGKLLTELPEIRVGEKVYPVDNRKKTVSEMNALMQKGEVDDKAMDKVARLALGDRGFKELNVDDLPFPAYQKLFELLLAAMTGEDPEKAETEARFPDSAEKP